MFRLSQYYDKLMMNRFIYATVKGVSGVVINHNMPQNTPTDLPNIN